MSHPRAIELSISDEEFRRISSLVERHFGISLPPEKRMLVASRLRGPVRRAGFSDLSSWATAKLRDPPPPDLLSELADALTTNHTYFWREPEHFVHFRDVVLPECLRTHEHDRDLRVWCAAAATGEEPYQLAMVLRDALEGRDWQAGLLATDLSSNALEQARAGQYSADRLRALPEPWRRSYVQVGADGSGTMRAELRADITFRRLNLLDDGWRFRKPFDVIFCRNVLIYFEPPVRDRVVTNLVRFLRPGGVLYVGHAESVPRRWALRALGPGIWRKEAA